MRRVDPSFEFDPRFGNEILSTAQPPKNLRYQVVSHFPRYSDSVRDLPVAEQEKIAKLARFVVYCLRSGKESIQTIQVVGHADLDTPRRPTVERRVAKSSRRFVASR
jgi:hypothetical protein